MKKVTLLKIFLILIAILIVIRLFYLCLYKYDYYHELYNLKTEKEILGASAPRGRIMDRNGIILVDNKSVNTIYYHKLNNINTEDEINIAKKLSEILNIDKNQIKRIDLVNYYLLKKNKEDLITIDEYKLYKERKLTKKDINNLKIARVTDEMLKTLSNNEKKVAYIYALMNKGYIYDDKLIYTNLTDSEFGLISELKLPGVKCELSFERVYNYGSVLRSIFGNLSKSLPRENKKELINKGYSINDSVGISYLEKEYEEYLKGEKAVYKINSDNSLELIKEAIRGNDIYLNIDINLQLEIESVLESKLLLAKSYPNTEYYNHSYVIVGEPLTGNIVAISGKRIVKTLNGYSYDDITSNIINSSYIVGSVVKGATISVGYKTGAIKPKMRVNDGCIKLYNVPKKCSFKSLGVIDDKKALGMSSNYYQFLIAIKSSGYNYKANMKFNPTLENFNLYRNTLAEFGLGVKTDIDLPNEQVGIKGKSIAGDLLLNLAIGQYDTYTPIELLQYINTVSSGERVSLNIMKQVISNKGEIVKENKTNVLNTLSLDKVYLDRIRLGLKEVLSSGTGRGYTDLKYNPAGKTGTSESLYDSNNDGILEIKTISSAYAMYAPFNNPKYSLVVMSPNISHNNGKTDYMLMINKQISKEVSKKLFENY